MLGKKLVDHLEKSFWFIPTLFAIFPFIILFGIFEYAVPSSDLITKYIFFLHVVSDPQAAKLILGAIAGAAITIISISFSITIVVLSIASQQYSPRLLQNFMRQNDTKIILGIFISTFIYCLISIGLTQDSNQYEAAFTMIAFIGLLLGILSLMAFIYFINFVIQSISLSNIIYHIEKDIISTISKFYPDASSDADLEYGLGSFDHEPCQLMVRASETGYLQSINYDQLLSVAASYHCRIKVLYHVGDYVIENTTLCEIFYDKAELSSNEVTLILDQFFVRNDRKVGEDILFPINQLVDIAVKALSPGVNDPKTAINCMDTLAKVMVFLSQRKAMPSQLMRNQEICIMRPVYTYEDLIKASFRNIYDNAKNSRVVLEHFMYIISKLLEIPSNQAFKAALAQEAHIIRSHNDLSAFDKKALETRYPS